MSLDVGFASQAPSLPQGGASMAGLGETFTPDLSMGTGSLTIPLDGPNGPNDIGPRLTLRYDTGSGNGPFGLGFSVPLPRLLRSVARGYPRYDASDTLVLEGAGELLALGGGAFRPQVDAGGWRATAQGDGFRATDREGRHYFLGLDAASRLSDAEAPAADPTRVFAWHLERIEDSLGNRATFTWLRDRNQLYLSRVAYGTYEVRLDYESRPDRIWWGHAGFPIHTALRCARIELHLVGAAPSLLRRFSLTYDESAPNGASFLARLVLSGFDEAGQAVTAPPLDLGYSGFRPRELVRFTSVDEAAAPGPLRRTDRRMELLDWNGDGLPDLVEISPGGRARRWPNLGDCEWGRPQIVGEIPLFASSTAVVGFADMNGDGTADVIRLDRPVSGYVPHQPGGGFGRPVAWRQAPAVAVAGAPTRLMDLDGDGILDLLTSRGEHLSLYYRSDPEGWRPEPQVVPRGEAPPVNLADPRVFVADMTGDGSPALVRVDGAAVTYWPYLGRGRWAKPVQMEPSPELPFDVRPDRLFFNDVDGDGCADLIYLAGDRVLYWHNRAGQGFSPPRVVEYVPGGRILEFRLADMRGSGTSGLLWSMAGPLGRGAAYYYLDFTGDTKPYLLTRIDNGVGLTTTITYSTSAREAARDARLQQPWPTFLPVPVPVVSTMTLADEATGRRSVTSYRYHDGRYDGTLREFAGFGRVDEEQEGDTSIPTLRTTSFFHIGVDPERPEEPQTVEERRRKRAIRGRLYRQERRGLDGSPQQDSPYDRLEQTWTVLRDGPAVIPRLVATVRSTFERTGSPAAVLTTTNLAWDAHGNITEAVQASEAPGDPAQKRALRTVTVYAHDPRGRFLARACRVRQFEGETLVADAITDFDGAPEGTVGTQGLITRRTALVLSDARAAEVYGAEPPDFAALGYHRRPGEDGWWTHQSSYERVDDAGGLRGRVTGPRGAVTQLVFDPQRTYPTQITDARGNVVRARPDYRVFRVRDVTDASGAVRTAVHDALSRPVALIEPGDSAALPTVGYEYVTGQRPVERITRRRAVSGAAGTVDTRERFDGSDGLIERRTRDATGEIVVESTRLNARGLPERSYREHRPASAGYALPADALASATFRYDALGRLVRRQTADGGTRALTYGPLGVVEADEEDSREGGGAPHAGTPTRITFFPTGRVRAIEENLAGRLLKSSYEYDVKGDLVGHVDAEGRRVRMFYDLLGRRLRVDRPEQTVVHVLDPAGNVVETRGGATRRVFRAYDALERLAEVRHGAANSAPVVRFTYHDTDRPAPAEAGPHTLGRAVRVEDAGGTTVFAYDARGQVVRKAYLPPGGGRSYELEFAYRADGQVAEIRYPQPDGGGARTTLEYRYDPRGLLSSVPTVVDAVELNLAGQRTRVRFANGVDQEYAFDERSGRLRGMTLRAGAAVLRAVEFRHDLAGNLLAIDSPDAKLALTLLYDDLYRLVAADAGDGLHWTYKYSDAGDLTFKSDVGSYVYGEGGAPATCLTTAGGQALTYTPHGEVASAAWGIHTWDAEGRLVRVASPDGASRVDFVYDYTGMRVGEKSVGRTPAMDRLTPDAHFMIDGGQLVLHLFDGTGVAARQVGAVRQFLHPDHLGGLAVVTDAAGAVLDRRRYDPYGKLLERTGAGPAVPFDFNGGQLDASGLVYLATRYYHPGIGRFVSPDTVVAQRYEPASWAPYAYCYNNPMSFADPSGANGWSVFFSILALVALVALYVLVSLATIGMATPLATALVVSVAVGVVSGGVVGGVAAGQKGGDVGDIITGVLVGAAVGGFAAFGSFYATPAVAGLWGTKATFLGTVTAGAAGGAITGAGMGFAAGFAGGKGTPDEVWQKMLAGAALGALSGGVTGTFAYTTKALVVKVDFSAPSLGKAAGMFLAGAGAEIGTKYAQGKEVDWLQVLAAGGVTVGFSSFVNVQSGTEAVPSEAVQAGSVGSAKIPGFLDPRYLGATSSVFSSVSTASFILRSPVNPAVIAKAIIAVKGY